MRVLQKHQTCNNPNAGRACIFVTFESFQSLMYGVSYQFLLDCHSPPSLCRLAKMVNHPTHTGSRSRFSMRQTSVPWLAYLSWVTLVLRGISSDHDVSWSRIYWEMDHFGVTSFQHQCLYASCQLLERRIYASIIKGYLGIEIFIVLISRHYLKDTHLFLHGWPSGPSDLEAQRGIKDGKFWQRWVFITQHKYGSRVTRHKKELWEICDEGSMQNAVYLQPSDEGILWKR